MKRTITILVVVIVIALLALPKLGLFGGDKNTGGGQRGPGGPVPVHVQVARPANMEDEMIIGGSLKANEEVDLIAEVAGKVTGIHFKEGESVRKGQLLLKINDDELRASLGKIEVSLKLAKEMERRQKALLDKGGISQQEYDIAVTELNSLEEEMKRVKAQIAKTAIIAPFDGMIGLRDVSEGSYLSPNTRIASLVSSDPVKIDFAIPEKYAAAMSEGQQVRFFVHGVDSPFVATVYAREPRIDEATRTLRVRALAPNKQGKLLPGSFARVELGFKPSAGSVTIPSEAIIPVLKGQKVFIVKNGLAQERMIETGIRNEQAVEVIQGLEAGDSVVVSGILQVKPNAKVMVLKDRNTSKEGEKK
jgi:membrane fusion protein, multidrug efflux system